MQFLAFHWTIKILLHSFPFFPLLQHVALKIIWHLFAHCLWGISSNLEVGTKRQGNFNATMTMLNWPNRFIFVHHYLIIISFLQLGKYKEALEFAVAAQSVVPSNIEIAELIDNLQKNLAAGVLIAKSCACLFVPSLPLTRLNCPIYQLMKHCWLIVRNYYVVWNN